MGAFIRLDGGSSTALSSFVPVHSVIDTAQALFIIASYSQYNLQNALLYSPNLFENLPAKQLFIVYQVCLEWFAGFFFFVS